MIGFLIDYIPELMPTHFEYCKPMVFTEPVETTKPKPEPVETTKPKPLPQLPEHIIRKIMLYQPRPEYIKAIKSLFRDFSLNCANEDKERTIDISHYFKDYMNNELRHQLLRLYKTHNINKKLENRHLVYPLKLFKGSITPFSFHGWRRSGRVYLYINDCEQLRRRGHRRCVAIADSWIKMIGRCINQKKLTSVGSLNPRHISTKLLKRWCLMNGLELKKSWSRKTIITKLIKMT